MYDIPAPPDYNPITPTTREGPTTKLETPNQKLERLLASQAKIAENKSKLITFSQPILSQNDNPVFFPKTINVIQGKAGVHKSRLAETICSSLLKKMDCHHDLLHFKCSPFKSYAICYVDTERNLSEQLPYSLQQIQIKAGYEIEENPYGFDFISLLEFDREERFDMLNMYIDHIRKKFQIHLFIVLDVITDCVFNFNDTKDSMKLIDMMNQTINRYDVTFLCLIHENPGSADKARGHLGTEILNKASTVLQIGFEKDSENASTNLIKVSYLKCRSSRKHDPFYVQYSDTERGLVMADNDLLTNTIDNRNQKAGFETTLEFLALWLIQPMTRRELIDKLCEQLKCKERTIETRLKQIIKNEIPVVTNNGSTLYLCKRSEGKDILYELTNSIPISNKD